MQVVKAEEGVSGARTPDDHSAILRNCPKHHNQHNALYLGLAASGSILPLQTAMNETRELLEYVE